jgi:hypothetical protein
MFIKLKYLETKSISCRPILNQKQSDEEEVFNYLCSFISIDARYAREIKSSIVTSKKEKKKHNPSVQIL